MAGRLSWHTGVGGILSGNPKSAFKLRSGNDKKRRYNWLGIGIHRSAFSPPSFRLQGDGMRYSKRRSFENLQELANSNAAVAWEAET